MPPEPVLWHIKISHYNEKARWALDYKGVPHHRRAPMPGGHALVALARTRRSIIFPVLELDGRAIGDSTRIIAALEERFPDPPLYPAHSAQRARALALEEYFDEQLGPDVRRIAFWEILRARDLLRENAAEMTSPRQGWFMRRTAPVMAPMMQRRYGVSEATAEQSLLKTRAAMLLLEDLLDGGEHLVGDAFTVADLTAAALLAPIVVPPELPYRRADMPLPAGLQEIQGARGAAGRGVGAPDLRAPPAAVGRDRRGRGAADLRTRLTVTTVTQRASRARSSCRAARRTLVACTSSPPGWRRRPRRRSRTTR